MTLSLFTNIKNITLTVSPYNIAARAQEKHIGSSPKNDLKPATGAAPIFRNASKMGQFWLPLPNQSTFQPINKNMPPPPQKTTSNPLLARLRFFSSATKMGQFVDEKRRNWAESKFTMKP
jgi:hypothetical protein